MLQKAGIYTHPAAHPPRLSTMADIASQLGMDISEEDLVQYTGNSVIWGDVCAAGVQSRCKWNHQYLCSKGIIVQ